MQPKVRKGEKRGKEETDEREGERGDAEEERKETKGKYKRVSQNSACVCMRMACLYVYVRACHICVYVCRICVSYMCPIHWLPRGVSCPTDSWQRSRLRTAVVEQKEILHVQLSHLHL